MMVAVLVDRSVCGLVDWSAVLKDVRSADLLDSSALPRDGNLAVERAEELGNM